LYVWRFSAVGTEIGILLLKSSSKEEGEEEEEEEEIGAAFRYDPIFNNKFQLESKLALNLIR